MTTLVQNSEKLMADIEKLKPYTYFERDFESLYNSAWTNWDLANFNLKFAKDSNKDSKYDKYHQEEYQEIYDKYSKIYENLKTGLEDLKVRVEEQKFIDNGFMSRQTFKQKMLEFKKEFEDLLYSVERWNSYIYNGQRGATEDFHNQIRENIDRVKYILEQFEAGNTNELYHRKTYVEFSHHLKFAKDRFKKLQQEENKFIAPRSEKPHRFER